MTSRTRILLLVKACATIMIIKGTSGSKNLYSLCGMKENRTIVKNIIHKIGRFTFVL